MKVLFRPSNLKLIVNNKIILQIILLIFFLRDEKNRELSDNIHHMLNQFLFNQFAEKLSNLLIVEIQRHTVPIFVAKLDNIKQQIQTEVAQKLTTTDKVLKENISQVCKSKVKLYIFRKEIMGLFTTLFLTFFIVSYRV